MHPSTDGKRLALMRKKWKAEAFHYNKELEQTFLSVPFSQTRMSDLPGTMEL